METLKNMYNTVMQLSRNLKCPLSESRTQGFFMLILTLILLIFFFSNSNDTSPAISYTSLTSRIHSPSPSDQVSPLSSVVSPEPRLFSDNYGNCTDSSAALSPVGTAHKSSRNAGNCSVFNQEIASCDIFDGHWVIEDDFDPLYKPGSCPYVDDAFNCFKNGRP
ncbi:protein trichome birefringence-like 4 [Abeliophyllum distichum]|uniref:Protein trichome birefringence-like 4 n=1 Tax=Abeliophyllum distichum TaxID=126358 RepID=A0ABD1T298_9LAMI